MLNEASTRSHCIFTINIDSKEPGSSVVKTSKLHLVDLAGSERVHKTNSTGNTLVEARSINLSLYFLERFILSISEGQEHIPYRESLITTVLKDSIGGNCKTIMIATVNPSFRHLEESISSCKFAMRVASIKQNAVINEKLDPYVQIRKLKKRVEQLEEELKYYKGEGNSRDALDNNEKAIVKQRVIEYVDDPERDSELTLGGDHLRVREAFILLKEMVLESRKSATAQSASGKRKPPEPVVEKPPLKAIQATQQELSEDIQEKLKNLAVAVELRDIEIDILVSILNKKQKNMSEVSIQTDMSQPTPSSPSNFVNLKPSDSFTSINSIQNIQTSSGNFERKPLSNIITKEGVKEKIREQEKSLLSQPNNQPVFSNEKIAKLADATGMKKRAVAFEEFRSNYRKYNVIEKNKQVLQEKHVEAKSLAGELNAKKTLIEKLKNRLIQLRTERAAQNLVDKSNAQDENEFPEELELKSQILRERDIHQAQFNQLKEVKKEIEHLKRVLDNSLLRLQQEFENWYKTTHAETDEVDDGMEENQSVVSSIPSVSQLSAITSVSNISYPANTLMSDVAESRSPKSQRTIKQAWAEDDNKPNKIKQPFSEDNPFLKKLREHMGSESTPEPKPQPKQRISLLQQAYKL